MIITDPDRRTRLLKLARLANFLDDLPHDRFHMTHFLDDDASAHSCGTAACAAGWAVNLYHAEGFIIKHRSIRFGVHEGETAFAEFFGISPDESYDITINLWDESAEDACSLRPGYCREYGLDDPEDITPRHAADRIRKVLNSIDPSIVVEADRAHPPALPAPRAGVEAGTP